MVSTGRQSQGIECVSWGYSRACRGKLSHEQGEEVDSSRGETDVDIPRGVEVGTKRDQVRDFGKFPKHTPLFGLRSCVRTN